MVSQILHGSPWFSEFSVLSLFPCFRHDQAAGGAGVRRPHRSHRGHVPITDPRGIGAPTDKLGGNAGLPRTLNRPKDELLEATLARLVKTKKGGKNKKRPPAAGAATMDGATAATTGTTAAEAPSRVPLH